MKKILFIIFITCSQITFAQSDSIFIFGSDGPYPAFQKIADAFEKEYNIEVIITKDPLPNWEKEAHQKADLIFSGSEHMMTQFSDVFAHEIYEPSILPLYKRESGLIVRKGNPKKVRSIRDLVKKDLRIMVVQGAGLTGVWEDMLGSLKHMKDFRAVRSKIVFYAGNGGLAAKEWKENPNIDIWMSWNIWQLANHETADFVSVRKRHRIYRNTGIVLTLQGVKSHSAKLFYDFVQSKQAQDIFKDMGWR